MCRPMYISMIGCIFIYICEVFVSLSRIRLLSVSLRI